MIKESNVHLILPLGSCFKVLPVFRNMLMEHSASLLNTSPNWADL